MSAPTSSAPSLRIPPWLRVKLPCNHTFADTRALVEGLKLNTVCQSAKCPNMFECFSSGTATFLILGGVCTRNCAFCNITPGQVLPPDPDEPARVAQAAHTLGLSHVVVTSVTRDDLPDGGAAHFAATIRALRATTPAQPQEPAGHQQMRVSQQEFSTEKQYPTDVQHQSGGAQSACSCGGTCGGDHDQTSPKPHDCLCNGGPADPTLPPSGGCACASKAHPAGLSPLVAGAHLTKLSPLSAGEPAAGATSAASPLLSAGGPSAGAHPTVPSPLSVDTHTAGLSHLAADAHSPGLAHLAAGTPPTGLSHPSADGHHEKAADLSMDRHPADGSPFSAGALAAGPSPLAAAAHLRLGVASGPGHIAPPSPQQPPSPSTPPSTSKVTTIEVLIPDFQGNADALQCVIDAAPDIINHNVETPPSHYARIRPQADYQQSLELLRRVRAAGAIAKSGLMVGLGETDEEVRGVLHDLAAAGCHIVTIGQYMRPSRHHPPVERYVHPDVFEHYAAWGREAGIPHVFSAPLVRSSYNAQSAYAALEAMRCAKG